MTKHRNCIRTIILFIFLLFVIVPVFAQDSHCLAGKKVIVFVAWRNFSDDQFKIVNEYLTNAGAEVIITSSSKGTAIGMKDLKLDIKKPLKRYKPKSDIDGIILIGGHGMWADYWDNADLQKWCIAMNETGKLIAAIGTAPGVLSGAGILIGKKATIWDLYTVRLHQGSARVINQHVVADGNIITADKTIASKLFIKEVIRYWSPNAFQHNTSGASDSSVSPFQKGTRIDSKPIQLQQ